MSDFDRFENEVRAMLREVEAQNRPAPGFESRLAAAVATAPRPDTSRSVKVGGPARVHSLRRWAAPLLVAAAVLAVAASLLVFSRGAKHQKPQPGNSTVVSPSPSPSPSPSTTPASPTERLTNARGTKPPSDFAALRIVGSRGEAAWKLSDTLRISTDAGLHWSTLALPTGVSPAAVDKIDVGPDTSVYLADASGRQVRLYAHRPGSSGWKRTVLTVHKPSNLSVSGSVYAFVLRAEPQTVAIVAGWGLTSTTGYTELFLSTDHGATFAARPTNLGLNIGGATFVNARIGFVNAGPILAWVYRTADGGRHWSRVLNGAMKSQSTAFGLPAATAKGLKVAQITGNGNGDQDVRFFTSSDQGAHFTASPMELLHVPGAFHVGDLDVEISDEAIWIPSSKRIYQSVDGQHWTTTPTSIDISQISLAGGGRAVGQVSADCSSNVASQTCESPTYLVATDDNGRHWYTV